VSLPALIWLVLRDLQERFPRFRAALGKTLLGASVALVVAQLFTWNYGESLMRFWSSSRMRGAVNTMFYKTTCRIEDDRGGVPRLAIQADDLGLLKPRMIPNLRLDNFRVTPSPLNSQFSAWSELRIEKAADGFYALADGKALFKKEDRVVDGIFFAYLDAADHWEIFRVAHVSALPLSLGRVFEKDLEFTYDGPGEEVFSDFHTRFNLQDLPRGVCKLTAWAYDYTKRHVQMIPGAYEVDTVNGTVRPLGTEVWTADLAGHVKPADEH
jgi:hypothetical protein